MTAEAATVTPHSGPELLGQTVVSHRRQRRNRARASYLLHRRDPPHRRRSGRRPLGLGRERRLGVVVDPGGGEPATLTPDVDGDAGLRRQLGPPPADDVVLEGAGAVIVDERAVLER